MLFALTITLASTFEAASFRSDVSCYRSELERGTYRLSFEGQAAQSLFDFLSQPSVKKISSDFSEKREGLGMTCMKEGKNYSCSQQFNIEGGGPTSPGMIPEVKNLPAILIRYAGEGLHSFTEYMQQGAPLDQAVDAYGNTYVLVLGRRISCAKRSTISCRQFISPNGTTWLADTDVLVGITFVQQVIDLRACQI